MEEMLRIFPSAQIPCLCGNCEFIVQAWLRYLLLNRADQGLNNSKIFLLAGEEF